LKHRYATYGRGRLCRSIPTFGGRRRLLRSLAIACGGDEDRRDDMGAPLPLSLDSSVLASILVVVVATASEGAAGVGRRTPWWRKEPPG
jgi:hypothetical protein